MHGTRNFQKSPSSITLPLSTNLKTEEHKSHSTTISQHTSKQNNISNHHQQLSPNRHQNTKTFDRVFQCQWYYTTNRAQQLTSTKQFQQWHYILQKSACDGIHKQHNNSIPAMTSQKAKTCLFFTTASVRILHGIAAANSLAIVAVAWREH